MVLLERYMDTVYSSDVNSLIVSSFVQERAQTSLEDWRKCNMQRKSKILICLANQQGDCEVDKHLHMEKIAGIAGFLNLG